MGSRPLIKRPQWGPTESPAGEEEHNIGESRERGNSPVQPERPGLVGVRPNQKELLMGAGCPVPACRKTVRSTDYIMCAEHWYRVPEAQRDRIWRLYREAPGSRDHLKALARALRTARGLTT